MTYQEFDEIFAENPNKLQIDEDGNATAIIIDEECDPYKCTFNNDQCVVIDTSEYTHITLSLHNISILKKLITKAEKHYLKTL